MADDRISPDSYKRKRPYGQTRQWLEAHVAYEGDDCLIWPFSRTSYGYAQLSVNNRPAGGHRLMCRLAHGDPPQPKMHACHSCGNGHLGCVNPRHLRWGTRKENQRDMVEHGRSNRGKNTPLTEADVLAICAAVDSGESQRSIGTRYNIGQQTVSSIVRGKNWGWLTGRGST